MWFKFRPAAVGALAALLLLLAVAEARDNFFFPGHPWLHHGGESSFTFGHPGLSITINKGGQEETPPTTTATTTVVSGSSSTNGGGGAGGGGSSVPEGGKVRAIIESGQPTVLTPDGRRLPIPPGQVIYITPPSGSNGPPGIRGPLQPDDNGPPPRTVTVWNPDGPQDGQPNTPVVITPDGVPLPVDPNQPGLEVFWPSPGGWPFIMTPNNQVPRQANPDCSDIAGTWTWSCTCSGKCRTETATWIWEDWHPVRAVVSADCSVQMTMQLCVTGSVGTGPAQVWAVEGQRWIVTPASTVCPPGWRCPGTITLVLPGYNQRSTNNGMDCRVNCQPNRGLPAGVRVVPRVRPRARAGPRNPPGPQNPQPSGSPPPPDEQQQQPRGQQPGGSFKDTMLNNHNRLRRNHGAQPLQWDDKLAREAQAWADKCTGNHDDNRGKGIGENMHGAVKGESPAEAATRAIEGKGNDNERDGTPLSWYGERRLYRPGKDVPCTASKYGAPCHFTQLVWKSANRLGCGYNPNCDNVSAIVCRYAGGPEAGNLQGSFLNNVQP